jgi:hypothetical protein
MMAMKRFSCLITLILLILTANVESQAWVFVSDYRDTGWQTFTYQTGSTGFTGTAGFVISNAVDNSAYSKLLLANLNYGGGGNNGNFQLGNLSGYSLVGNSFAQVVTSATDYYAVPYYSPTGGDFLEMRCVSAGVSTKAFQNYDKQSGTVGSILETAVDIPANSKFTFDWAFLAGDQMPYDDFSLFYLKDSHGNIVYSAGLGQIGHDPRPIAPGILFLLLGSP